MIHILYDMLYVTCLYTSIGCITHIFTHASYAWSGLESMTGTPNTMQFVYVYYMVSLLAGFLVQSLRLKFLCPTAVECMFPPCPTADAVATCSR